MNRLPAKIISALAHPVFVNLLCVYLLFQLYPPLFHGLPHRVQQFYISFIFITTSIVPIILVLVMRITGHITTITLEKKEDRRIPYLATIALYVFNFYNFYQAPNTHPLILTYLLACAAIIGVVYTINILNKISIHLATLGALCGLLCNVSYLGYYDTRFLLGVCIAFSGLVASARLSLNAHTPKQLYTGFLIGLVLMFFIMNLSFTFV